MSINAPETHIVQKLRIACDGGVGALGHPRVWLQIAQDRGFVECPYCDAHFVHESYVKQKDLLHKSPDGSAV